MNSSIYDKEEKRPSSNIQDDFSSEGSRRGTIDLEKEEAMRARMRGSTGVEFHKPLMFASSTTEEEEPKEVGSK